MENEKLFNLNLLDGSVRYRLLRNKKGLHFIVTDDPKFKYAHNKIKLCAYIKIQIKQEITLPKKTRQRRLFVFRSKC